MGNSFNNERITYLVGYNQTHLQGVGDLIEAAFPALDQYDLDTILMQIAPEVTTRKIVIVGHSQGAEYANKMYDYLAAHGELGASMGVYGVATPAAAVAGGGSYRTYDNDVVINSIRGHLGFNPLPANLDFVDPYPDDASAIPGHSFSNAYLAAAPDTIVGDIQSELSKLSVSDVDAASTGDCFDPPQDDLGYKAESAAFGTGDALADGLYVAGKAGVTVGSAAVEAAGVALSAVGSVAQKVATDVNVTTGGLSGLAHAGDAQNRDLNFEILSKLYGSSLTKEEYDEYLGSGQSDQGGAVALATVASDDVVAPQSPPPQFASTAQITQPAAPAEAPPVVAVASSGSEAPPPAQDAATQSDVTDTDDIVATTTQNDATSTAPDVEGPLPAVDNPRSASFIVADNFDSLSGWSTYGSSGETFISTSTDCHAGGCVTSGTLLTGSIPRMYKTGAPTDAGELTVWSKYNAGFTGMGAAYVEICSGAPSDDICDGWDGFQNPDNAWHQYYLAWRDDSQGAKDFCKLKDDTNQSDCTWSPSGVFAAGDTPDTIVLGSTASGRPDLGDELWFDDLGE